MANSLEPSWLHRSRPWLAARQAGRDPGVRYCLALRTAQRFTIATTVAFPIAVFLGQVPMAVSMLPMTVMQGVKWRALRRDKPTFLAKAMRLTEFVSDHERRRVAGTWAPEPLAW